MSTRGTFARRARARGGAGGQAAADAGSLRDLVQPVGGVERGDLVRVAERRHVEDRVDEVVDGQLAGHHGLADVDELGRRRCRRRGRRAPCASSRARAASAGRCGRRRSRRARARGSGRRRRRTAPRRRSARARSGRRTRSRGSCRCRTGASRRSELRRPVERRERGEAALLHRGRGEDWGSRSRRRPRRCAAARCGSRRRPRSGRARRPRGPRRRGSSASVAPWRPAA